MSRSRDGFVGVNSIEHRHFLKICAKPVMIIFCLLLEMSCLEQGLLPNSHLRTSIVNFAAGFTFPMT